MVQDLKLITMLYEKAERLNEVSEPAMIENSLDI